MKFLCLAYLDRGLSPGPDVAAEYGALSEAMRAAGAYVDSGQLSPGDAAKLVRVTAGEAEVTDGPPTAAGQAPGAYFVLDCADLQAPQAAHRCRQAVRQRGAPVGPRPRPNVAMRTVRHDSLHTRYPR